MIEKALEYQFNLGVDSPRVVDVHTDDTTRHVLVVGNDETPAILQYSLPSPKIRHKLLSLDSFCEYINKHGESGVVFVGQNRIVADLAYKTHKTHTLYMDLDQSDAFKALNQLFAGVKQKELWRLLITHLNDHIPCGLLLAVSGIRVAASQEALCSISSSGLSDQSNQSRVIVHYTAAGGKGEQQKEIPTEWVFTGPIFSCALDAVHVIPLRLEVSSEGGLSFRLHPRNLESTIREARANVVEAIEGVLDAQDFQVYQGEYDA